MNTTVINRGNLFVLALIACGVLFIALPATTEAHHPKNGTATSTEHMKMKKEHGTSTATSTRKTGKKVDATCMAAAVDTREAALNDAWSGLSTDILAALTVRKEALQSAWNLTDMKSRNAAVVAAWKDWRDDRKTAQDEFRKDRKAAWDAFKKTAKSTCKVTVPKDEGLETADSDSVTL